MYSALHCTLVWLKILYSSLLLLEYGIQQNEWFLCYALARASMFNLVRHCRVKLLISGCMCVYACVYVHVCICMYVRVHALLFVNVCLSVSLDGSSVDTVATAPISAEVAPSPKDQPATQVASDSKKLAKRVSTSIQPCTRYIHAHAFSYMTLCDIHVWYTCVIYMCDIHVIYMCDMHVWYTCVIYMCDIHVWYTCVIYMCDIHVWYACVICMCDIHVWYTCVIYMCDMHVWYTCVIYMCDIHVWYTCVVYMCDIHVWYTCVIYMCDIVHVMHICMCVVYEITLLSALGLWISFMILNHLQLSLAFKLLSSISELFITYLHDHAWATSSLLLCLGLGTSMFGSRNWFKELCCSKLFLSAHLFFCLSAMVRCHRHGEGNGGWFVFSLSSSC